MAETTFNTKIKDTPKTIAIPLSSQRKIKSKLFHV